MKKRTFILLLISALVLPAGYATIPKLVEDWLRPEPETDHHFTGPGVFKDKVSETIFYVESDGRHVSAVDQKGKILWHRDPFTDAKLEPYRRARPVICWIGPPSEWSIEGRKGKFIGIAFDSSQFGIINVANGEFICLGQD